MSMVERISVINDLVECYRSKRSAHIKKEWLKLSSIWGRIWGTQATFEQMRTSDFNFTDRARNIVNIHIAGLSSEEISDIVLYLKNHSTIIEERDFFLLIYAAILGILLLVPRDDFRSWTIAGLATLFGLVGLFERWNLKQHVAVYKEIIELLQAEAKKKEQSK